ncbi:FLYWCH-type zinc finger-containing protein 1 [Aphis craccivora]|uniref:FLYWCH-type zinc finger-containing protein 1 n=1 Tax=Aphis craccivora TaxID=307492 RepID=A0A6G0YI26_APHCR|nr:FLYWCH-type zinc finger-containing protein 1 [Aphis craccivora]
MALEYVLSEKNKYMLIHQGFLHVKEREHENKIYWKCTEYKKIHCKGRVNIVDDKVTKCIEHNNHIPNAAKIEA